MKKVFKILLLVSFVWPIMISCEPQPEPDMENPNSYETPEDWLAHWTTGDQDSALVINEANITGTWELYGWALVPDGEQITDYCTIATSSVTDKQYLQLNSDKTFEHNKIGESAYGAHPVCTKGHGAWAIAQNRLTLSYNRGSEPSLLDIRLLEKERMVMTHVVQIDSEHKGMVYSLYKRVPHMPELPLTMAERLTQRPWRLLADSVYTIIEHFDGEAIQSTIQEVKTGLLPNGAGFRFEANGNLTITDAEGNTVGNYTWEGTSANTFYSTNNYLIDYEPVLFRSIDNPLNIPDFMDFYPDYQGTTARFENRDYSRYLDMDGTDTQLIRTVYHLEQK